ncbi:hypothetical protein K2173_025717 [Erythroxylum novogranatense]|uniref:Uncharacterized protein n=1 Tax=Erythroxylum novogranatense TaxID=1862640 RepID=A0AAV8SBL4_9ROSI|nr:hypothetical protein K2173_025717 [Erythroxylum novogranatense]
MAGLKRKRCTDSDIRALHQELDDVSCPICMEHPHNAVLLLCSSHEKGCRSYICDTSYRHSNCLDRFKKMRDNSWANTTLLSSLPVNSLNFTSDTNSTLRSHLIEVNEYHNWNESIQDPTRELMTPGESFLETEISESWRNRMLFEGNSTQNSTRMPDITAENNPSRLETQGESSLEAYGSEYRHGGSDLGNSSDLGLNLQCPLCRGAILGWKVVEEARQYLNLKKRSCSRESCSFSGNYQELRRHARMVHPSTRPSEIDPSRERAWRCLEHQREYGDIVSAIRSAIPGAVVVGDYVVENSDRLLAEMEDATGVVNTPWWSTMFLFQMIHSIDGIAEPRARSRTWTRNRRSTGPLPETRFLWGENLLGLQDDEDDDEADVPLLGDAGEDVYSVPRRRGRLNRSRFDDQS